MTREEITEKLKSLKADIVSCGGCEGKKDYAQALTETIEALQTEHCEQIKWERDVAIGQLKALGYGLGEKIEPCEDAISRQDAIEFLKKSLSICCMMEYLENAPSVNPQKVIRCKDCKFAHKDWEDNYYCERVDESSFCTEENGFCAWAKMEEGDGE